MTLDDIISSEIGVEGGHTNNPNDAGGETIWGITEKVARENGYTGPMAAMPRDTAVRIYKLEYVVGPGFDRVWALAGDLGAELIDIGINMGTATAGMWLQRALNALNRQQKDYADVPVTGNVGPLTMQALNAYLTCRGADGASVLTEVVRCLRGADYVRLCEGRPADEEFAYGWFKNRVMA